MATMDLAKKGLYVGTGVGLILFVLVGILPGSIIGGMVGLKAMEIAFGNQVDAAIISRVVVAFSMIAGIMMSALTMIGGMSALGWTLGFVAEAVQKSKVAAVPAMQETK